MILWDKVKNFKKDEFSNFKKMDTNLVYRLDAFRTFIGHSMIITSSNDGVHEKNSQHYLGRAVDIICPAMQGKLLSLLLSAERFGFTGIGIYPHWCLEGKMIGGLHLDTRIVDASSNYLESRWMGVLEDNKQVYKNYDMNNLKKYGLLK